MKIDFILLIVDFGKVSGKIYGIQCFVARKYLNVYIFINYVHIIQQINTICVELSNNK